MRFFFNNLIWSIILLDDFIHDNDDFGSKDKFVAPFACKKSFWGQHKQEQQRISTREKEKKNF